MSTKALITLPSTVSDLLMLVASLSLLPSALVYFCLSEPAKSTKLNFEVLTFVTPSATFLDSIVMEKTECDLLDSKFI